MSLQGTLATFSIPDVLQLLASTKKSGKLAVTGDGGDGALWLDAGEVVAATCTGDAPSTDAVAVVMSMLRYEEGSFVFEDGAISEDASSPLEVPKLLEEANALAEEWAELEAVVPSTSAWVSLSVDLPEDEVVVDRETWSRLVAIRGGRTAGALGDDLDLDRFAAARAIKTLVEAGLVQVDESAPEGALVEAPTDIAGGVAGTVDEDEAEAPADEAPADTEEADTEEADTEEADTEEAEAEEQAAPAAAAPPPPVAAVDDGPQDTSFDPDQMLREMSMGTAPAASESSDDGGFLPSADDGLGGLSEGAAEVEIDPADAAEMARQLANLSPEAAKAVAAAAKATTEADLQRALDDVVALDSTINRDLLVKFLGSVNS